MAPGAEQGSIIRCHPHSLLGMYLLPPHLFDIEFKLRVEVAMLRVMLLLLLKNMARLLLRLVTGASPRSWRTLIECRSLPAQGRYKSGSLRNTFLYCSIQSFCIAYEVMIASYNESSEPLYRSENEQGLKFYRPAAPPGKKKSSVDPSASVCYQTHKMLPKAQVLFTSNVRQRTVN